MMVTHIEETPPEMHTAGFLDPSGIRGARGYRESYPPGETTSVIVLHKRTTLVVNSRERERPAARNSANAPLFRVFGVVSLLSRGFRRAGHMRTCDNRATSRECTHGLAWTCVAEGNPRRRRGAAGSLQPCRVLGESTTPPGAPE